MPSRIQWDKEIKEAARRQGNALFAYGYQEISTRQRGAPYMMGFIPTLTEEEAHCLTAFLMNLTQNKKPLDWCVKALKLSLKNCNKRSGIKD